MRKNKVIFISVALLAAVVLSGIAFSGLLGRYNNIVADGLYQKSVARTDQIVIFGIDQAALQEFGPWPWPRHLIADALSYLNADPEQRPAVIGVDTLFVGGKDTEADAYLAQAAGAYNNVVTAAAATFGANLVKRNDGSFYMDEYSILAYDQPFTALREVTEQGHINAMLDTDGILRHAIWQLDLPDGSTVPSFHQQIYRKYIQTQGISDVHVPPTDARHRWYVPLQGEPGAFNDGYSVAELVNGQADPDIFANKIVLIGPYAVGLQDSYHTAIDHAVAMNGVEYQANAIAALLQGDTKLEVSHTVQTIILFVLLLCSILWLKGRRMIPATVLWLGTSGSWLLLCVLLYNAGYVLLPLYIPLFMSACYVFAVATNYISEMLEKHRVTATFQRYVAPEIVSELLRGDAAALELGGKLTDIAVLFVDIRGFTSLSEELDPPTVVEIVNSYLTLTSQCIFQNGGTLDKYIGDCTMAIWGAPLPQEDCTFKAVKAAMDMVEGAKVLGEELQARYGRSVSFGIGVHYGPAVVGNIGSPIRMDYTAIGDTVNTSARLESNAPAGQILVSSVVVEQLQQRVQFASLGSSIRLKGKAAGFEIYRVEGLIEA